VSYCRKGKDSDLYIIGTGDGWECLCCDLLESPYESVHFNTIKGLWDHIIDHDRNGHIVPERVIDRVWCEMNGEPYITPTQRRRAFHDLAQNLSVSQRLMERAEVIRYKKRQYLRTMRTLEDLREEIAQLGITFKSSPEAIRRARRLLRELDDVPSKP